MTNKRKLEEAQKLITLYSNYLKCLSDCRDQINIYMDELQQDRIEADGLKAIRYKSCKLSVIDNEKLTTFLNEKNFNKGITHSIDLEKLTILLDEDIIKLNDLKTMISYKSKIIFDIKKK